MGNYNLAKLRQYQGKLIKIVILMQEIISADMLENMVPKLKEQLQFYVEKHEEQQIHNILSAIYMYINHRQSQTKENTKQIFNLSILNILLTLLSDQYRQSADIQYETCSIIYSFAEDQNHIIQLKQYHISDFLLRMLQIQSNSDLVCIILKILRRLITSKDEKQDLIKKNFLEILIKVFNIIASDYEAIYELEEILNHYTEEEVSEKIQNDIDILIQLIVNFIQKNT
eukprot:TRINITY_DN7027_c0_g1_i2.p1 TRINITY_DN7027_c0_g1~~TRINITY_DN7027_c0_g1_i2.p1  ORF type:complete len:228 (+),score=21.28 TRINITY_DN7027_c0_g1_i2:166-849(+)